MKSVMTPLFCVALMAFGCSAVYGMQQVSAVSDAAEGLDLSAVGDLFRNSRNLEEFEAGLNDPKKGINNIDLDQNGEVDFIRVLEEIDGGTHVIVMQAALDEDEYQDVATIEVERKGDDDYNFQLRGNPDIYGPDYYVVPANAYVRTWPIIGWIYRPVYRPYISPFRYRVYPSWYRPYRPVSVTVYRGRTVNQVGRSSFTVTRSNRVTTVSRTKYRSKTSTRTKTSVTRTRGPAGGRKTTVTRTRTRKRP